jgi:hypothetical protein
MARRELLEAETRQLQSRTASDRLSTAFEETRNIHSAWDTLDTEERGIIFQHWVIAVFIAVERVEGRKRGHPRTAIVYLAGAPGEPKLVRLGDDSAFSISSRTSASPSSGKRASNASRAAELPISPSAHAACARTNGSGSESAETNGGTAASEPQLPNATATLRRKPARPARRSADPRENESQASASMDMRSTSDGASVPGCQASEPLGTTPEGASPALRDAYARSDELAEKLRLNGHTSWVMCRLTRFKIPL